MTLKLLAGHIQTQNGREAEGRRIWAAMGPGEEPQTYRMAFLTAGGPRNCPVEGCPGRAAMRTEMQVQFSPACPGYCGHFGGGKPPPHTVPPLRHSGTLV